MKSELLSRHKTIGADLPDVNPSYDPNNPPTVRRGGRGGQRERGARGGRVGNRGDREGRGDSQNRERQNRN